MTEYVTPTTKQFWEGIKLPSTGPVNLFYLILLNDKADYPDGRDATGAEAYQTYITAAGPIFTHVGGKIIWRGKPEHLMVGPDDKQWDIALIAEFPSMAAFGEMVEDPAFQAAAFHRQAAVKDSRLIRMKPVDPEADFNI